jgi:hypothetical protein
MVMESVDYYCPETVTTTVGYGIGRGARAIQTVATEVVNPVKAGAGVGIVWGSLVALRNARKYKLGQMAGRDAVLDTAGESVGLSLAAGIGLVASNAVRGALLVASASSLIPFVTGVVVTSGVKVLWDCSTRRHWKCEVRGPSQPEQRTAAVKDGEIGDEGQGRLEHEGV